MNKAMKKHRIKLILLLDAIIIIFGAMNFSLFFDKAGLPDIYKPDINSFTYDVKNIYHGERIIEFDGIKISDTEAIDFYLLNYKPNDIVNIKSNADGRIIERDIPLPSQFCAVELSIMATVTIFYFFTGIFILLRFKDTVFSLVIHMVCILTGVMIASDWGDLTTLPSFINFINFFLFECGTFLVPVFFLHFSFTYPIATSRYSMRFLVPLYIISITFIIISSLNIISVFYFGKDIAETYLLDFHNTVSDIMLIIGLILTVAKLEHTVLKMTNILYRKKVYWALLGISFGPLIYVFMILLPRLIMGHQLVSQSLMEFTIIIAPIMLLISVTRKNGSS
jgi:hypothetical protein